MKKYILLLIFHFALYEHGFSQTAGINYQAVARDAQGTILANKSLSVLVSILSNDINGDLIWQEEHNPQTNVLGLFTLVIGNGIYKSGSSSKFENINWGASTHFLKVEIDFGQGYKFMGTTQMLYVPYAYYAVHSGDTQSVFTYDPSNYILSVNGSAVCDLSGIRNDALQEIKLNGSVLSLSKTSGSVDLINVSKQALSLKGHVLSLTPGNWVTLPDTVNEFQDLMEKNDSIFLNLVHYPHKIDLTQKLTLKKNNLSIKRGNTIAIDADTTNELITTTSFDGDNLHITEAGKDHSSDLSALKNTPWVGFSANVTNLSFGTDETKDVIFSEEFYDNTNSFNSTTFTAPQTGVYLMNLNLLFQQGSYIISIFKSGTSFKQFPKQNIGSFSISFMMDLSINETVRVNVKNDSGTSSTLNCGSFSGYRVH